MIRRLIARLKGWHFVIVAGQEIPVRQPKMKHKTLADLNRQHRRTDWSGRKHPESKWNNGNLSPHFGERAEL